MKKVVVNLFAILVIVMGGFYLTIPHSANAQDVAKIVPMKVSECTAGNGATCTCEGSCYADGDSCECT